MKWLTASLRNKIIAVFTLGMAIVFGAVLYGFNAARDGLQAVDRVNDTQIAQAIQSQALHGSFIEQLQAWTRVLLVAQDPAARDKSWKQFQYRENDVRRYGEKLHESVTSDSAKKLLGEFLRAHAAAGDKYRKRLEAFAAAGFDATKMDMDSKDIDGDATLLIEEIVDLMREEPRAAVARAHAEAMRQLGLSLAAIVAATLGGLTICSLLAVRSIVRPLVYAARVTEQFAAGDLTVNVRASSRDETGRMLNGLERMRDGLAQAVTVIRNSAESVRSASRDIVAGQEDLSRRTETHASSLEETAASMEEIATTVRHNTESARQAQQLAQGTSQTAGEGGEVMAEAVRRMGGVSESSRRIADIIGVIDGIAFQTNILALNAAVEAARAGDQGRGFAVVASEVRALAQRVATAAKEIKTLIQNSVDEVAAGTRLVEAAGQKMQEVVTSVRKVTDVMGEIASASAEQLSGIEQVNRAVTGMDHLVQQNSALVEETVSATEKMTAQTDELVRAVAHFKLDSANDAAPVLAAHAQSASDEAHAEPPEPAHRAPRLSVAGRLRQALQGEVG